MIPQSADPSCADSSSNSAAHYAAAYGWLECLKLLVERGADPNAPNDWKTTPLAIAMQKGHIAIADYLLEQDSVDVNIRDDEGRTLVAQMMEVVSETSLKQLYYLLEKKNADVTTPDVNGCTPLHLVAKNYDREQALQDFKNSQNNTNTNTNNDDNEEDEEEEDEDEMEEEEEDEDDEAPKKKGRKPVKKAAAKKSKGKEKSAQAQQPAPKKEWKNYSVEIAKVLIKRGADVNAVTNVRLTHETLGPLP